MCIVIQDFGVYPLVSQDLPQCKHLKYISTCFPTNALST